MTTAWRHDNRSRSQFTFIKVNHEEGFVGLKWPIELQLRIIHVEMSKIILTWTFQGVFSALIENSVTRPVKLIPMIGWKDGEF